MTITSLLDNILIEINNIEGIKGSVIASREGLVIYSKISVKPSITIAAMSATIIGAGDQMFKELGNNSLDWIIAESKNEKIITIRAGRKALLIVMAHSVSNHTLILNEMIKASKQIEKILD